MNSGNKPNIIFFFPDQQRWDTLGCYGNPMNLTPNIDRMAREGVRFENAYSCQPVCGPARSCLQTGKYATETGCWRNEKPLPANEVTVAKLLKQSGYETAYIGKWHLAPKNPVEEEHRGGFTDYWLASNCLECTSEPYEGTLWDKDNNPVKFKNRYRADAITDFALDYLDRRESSNPFFLTISYVEPHFQNSKKKFIAPDGYAERYKDYYVPGDLEGLDIGDWKTELPGYYGMCKSLDENFGRLCDKLDQLGISDNTIIVYSSDHGCNFETRYTPNKSTCPEWKYKNTCHDASSRVPMIIYGPGFTGGKVINELVSIIDLPPTLLDAAGVGIPSFMRGRNLKQLVDGNANDWPKEVFIQISEDYVARAIRSGRWKYCVDDPEKDGWLESCSDNYVEQYLYDLENDPHERNNLVCDPRYRQIRSELSEILKRRMKEAGEKVPTIHPCPQA